MNRIYIYEDEDYRNLVPLVYLRPVFDLYCGIYTFRERVQKLYPSAQIYPLSRFNSETFEPFPSQTLFINGRAILHSPLPDAEGVFVADGEVIGFRVKSEKLKVKVPISIEFLTTLKVKLKVIEVKKAVVIKYPWDLIKWNEETIIKDIELMSRFLRDPDATGQKSKVKPVPTRNGSGSQKVKEVGIRVGESPRFRQSGVYLIEKEGPVYIGSDVQIKPPTVIEGPCCIGEGSLIDGAKIRQGTTIGKYCKIGGEVERSIFSDFSNKHHEGFVGHSYIGEWVNLGALTTTSDIKNTYSTIKVKINNKKLDTGLIKLGSFIGDHTKTGIGTLLDTGSVIGCFVNLYGGGVAPKYIPSFSWGTKKNLTEYKLDKAIEVAKKVMARRDKELTNEYVQRIYKLTPHFSVGGKRGRDEKKD
ncbi:MAG: hypothetical protein HY769_06060 [Candidatus Stahlbacteria bacterium]|nr:hypothetical protein [Candidatus Stahlbacteria bacterium]